MNQPTPLLTQGTWKVGRGFDIPINHPHWFPFKPDAPAHVTAQITKVADLINQDNATWKHDVIMQLYDRTNANKILEIALPKIQPHASSDLIIWPCSPTGEYQVKRAYTLLHQSQKYHSSTTRPATNFSSKIWTTLWKSKLPNKLRTFTWKILHRALPVKTKLNNKGIHCDPACILCNAQEESLNHIFLY